MDELVNIISSVGFPIFACIAMGYFISKTLMSFTETIDSFKQSFNDMSLTIKELIMRLEDNEKSK